jgi:hypothetical protein
MNFASIQRYSNSACGRGLKEARSFGGLGPSAVFDISLPASGWLVKHLEADQSVTPAERAALVKYQQDVKRQKYLKDQEEEDIQNADTTPKAKTAEQLAQAKKTAEFYKRPDVVNAENARREQIKKNAKLKGGDFREVLDRGLRGLIGAPDRHEHQYADLAKTDLTEDYDPSQDEYVKSRKNNKLYQRSILQQKRLREGKGKPPIVIPMKEFVAEHKKLIPILKKGTKKEQVKEALEQEAELKFKKK